jgi:hypothetical protein
MKIKIIMSNNTVISVEGRIPICPRMKGYLKKIDPTDLTESIKSLLRLIHMMFDIMKYGQWEVSLEQRIHFPEFFKERWQYCKDCCKELVVFWLDHAVASNVSIAHASGKLAMHVIGNAENWFLLDILKQNIDFTSELGVEVYEEYYLTKQGNTTHFSHIAKDFLAFYNNFLFHAETSQVCHLGEILDTLEMPDPIVMATLVMSMITGSSVSPNEFQNSEAMDIV